MSIADLRRTKEDEVSVLFNPKNKIYVQNFKTVDLIHGVYGNPSSPGVSRTPHVINLFPEVEIQANKSFIIDTCVKAYPRGLNTDITWLGLNVATNVKINGVWYSLGNSGRNVSANLRGSGMATYISKKYIDFQNLLTRGYVDRNIAYTVQVELVGSCEPNAHIGINITQEFGDTLPAGVTGVAAIADQNFTTIIIEETD